MKAPVPLTPRTLGVSLRTGPFQPLSRAAGTRIGVPGR